MKKDKVSVQIEEKELVYRGLKCLLQSNEGKRYFHNADRKHPIYTMGSLEKDGGILTEGDSPKTNELFKMLSKLSKWFKINGRKYNLEVENAWYDFSEWKDFCKFVIKLK